MISVISGINGFIGKHLSDGLLAKGHEVVGLSRDILADPVSLNKELKKIKPDYIFHLSAYGNHHSQTDEDEIISTNIIKTYLLLKASQNLNIKAFVNVSSSSTYGLKDKPMNEKDVLESDTFYGVSKIAGEGLGRAFAKKYDMPIVNAVLFSVYGPGEASHRFIPTLINNGINNQESTVTEGSHDWIYIQDVVDALIILAEKAKELKGKRVNIGTGNQLENYAIASLVSHLFFSGKLKIKEIKEKRSNDSNMWVSDNTLMLSLGWQPLVGMGDGLVKTHEFILNDKK